MEKEEKIDRSLWRKWIKYLFSTVFILLILTIFLFPPLYTKYILRPMLEETFSQLTNERYQLDFDKMRWKLFNRSIFLNHIRIQQANDSVYNPHIQYVELDTLSINGIQYLDLLTGEAKVKSLELINLNLGLNIYTEIDSSEKMNTKVVNRSGFLHSLELEKFNLDKFNMDINLDGDSLLQIRKADFSVLQLFADSLNYPNSIDLPIFEAVNINAKNVDFQKKKTSISIQDLTFSENQTIHQAVLKFKELLHKNLLNDNQQRIEEASFELDSIAWIEHPEKSFLKGNTLRLSLSRLVNTVNTLTGEKPEASLQKIKNVIENSGLDFEVDKIHVELKNLKQEHPQMDFEIVDLNYQIIQALTHQQKFEMNSYTLESDTMSLLLKKEGDSLSFSSFIFDQSQSTLNIKDIHFVKNKGLVSAWYIAMLKLEGFSPFQFLEEDILKLNHMHIMTPEVNINKSEFVHNQSNTFPILLDIDKFDMQNARFEWKEKGIEIGQTDLYIDNIIIPPGFSGHWESVFESGQGLIGKLEYQSHDGKMQVNSKDFKFDTNLGLLALKEIDVKSLYFSKENPGLIQAEELMINGVNWKELLNHSSLIKVDTIKCMSLNVIGNIISQNQSSKRNNTIPWSAFCSYINLPNIYAHIEHSALNNTSKINLEELDIEGAGLNLDFARPYFLEAKKLKFSAMKSFYSQIQDSLLLRIASWSFTLAQKRFDGHQVMFQYENQEDSSKIKSHLQIDIDKLSIGGIEPFDMYLEKQFLFDSIYINNPKLKLNGDRQTKIVYQTNAKSFYESLGHYIDKVKAVGVNDFVVEDLNLSIKNKYMERMDHIGLESFDLHVHDFYVDYKVFHKLDRFLFSENTELELNEYFQSVNNGERLIYLKSAKGSTSDNRLQVSDLQVLSLGDSIRFPANIRVKDILLNDLKMSPGNIQPRLFIGSLLFQEPELDLKSYKNKKEQKKAFSLEEIDFFNSIKGQFSAININRIELSDFDFSMPIRIKQSSKIYDFKNIDLTLEGIVIDSNNIAFTNDKFFYCDDVRLNLPQFSMISPDRFYNYSFENMSLSSHDKSIHFDSVMIVSRYDRKTFVANQTYQTDQMDITIPILKLEGIGYREAIFRNRYTLEKLEFSEAQIFIYKDKRLPPDTSKYKTMPAQAIENIRFYLNIDTIQFNDGFVKYEERSQIVDDNGVIFFDRMNGKIIGFSNDTDFRNFGGTLKINAQARLMSEADVSLNAYFPLNSKEQNFVVLASMNTLDATSLNPLLQPLTRMQAKAGVLSQLQMNVKGNDKEGYGYMVLRYEDLKVEVLKKNMEESNLASFLANSILIKQNNNNIFRIRKGPIFYERTPYRGVIHYLSHFAIMGAKTSLGIDTRKTARKIKQIEKALQK
ncbi:MULTISPECIES: hypothetical protein [unclassified Lentimicrobium]|uniref:hypothetical protein n=1 Tax=unclassified Lentimicrobium TaxID=2677434 RepID=UPI001551CED8|nr:MULTISPECIES: hypothetical protein [unclassified Lentimicrobium]NPD45217.1 hypothetical protein [Lentimicrobium sp. S6]NPD85396.1 hypothetical protein [Lentimicrobium sp. L6]